VVQIFTYIKLLLSCRHYCYLHLILTFSNLIPISPGGHQFESCKEASAYLLSVSGVQDKGHLKSSYTDDGAQQLSSSMNMASESVS